MLEDDELLLITTEGVMIRTACAGISILGRITTGVKIIDLAEGVTVASFTKVKFDPEDTTGEGTDADAEAAAEGEAAADEISEDAADAADEELDDDAADEGLDADEEDPADDNPEDA